METVMIALCLLAGIVSATDSRKITQTQIKEYRHTAKVVPLSDTTQQPLPELPAILPDNFGPAIREQVQKAYNEARSNSRDAATVGRLCMVLQTYEQHELAATCYERARRLAPTEFQWSYYLGTCQAALGRQREAITLFREVVQQKPEFLAARVRLADALFAAGELNESQQLYENISRSQPDIVQAHYGLGRVKAGQRETTAAIAHLRRALELFPVWGAAHYALALALRDAGETQEAREHLQLYQQHKNNRPPLNDPVLYEVDKLNAGAAEMLRQGIALEAAGKLTESIAEHERALEINSQFLQAHVNLIILYARTNQPEKAEQHYRAAIALNPGIAESHYNIGVLRLQQNRRDEAAQAFTQALESNPNFPEARYNLGTLLEQTGKLDEAAQHFRVAIANKPAFREAHFHLGRILVHQGDLSKAIYHFQQTLSPEDDNTPRYTYALAAAYVRAGDRLNGLRYAREARDKAAQRGQKELLAAIERDLKSLEQGK